MSISLTVRDLDLYPNNSKTITIDLVRVIPKTGYGDEEYVGSCTTTAYSNNTSSTAIQPIYIRHLSCGWSRSSGFVNGPFTISGTAQNLRVSIDGSTYREITLTTASGVTGSAVASDIKTQINALAATGQLEANNLAFKNADCTYSNDRFKITSGTFNENYTGSSRSSVNVLDGTSTTGLAAALGFDLPTESSSLASAYSAIRETYVSTNYTADAASLVVADGSGFAARDACMITDGTNTEYFVIISKTGNTFTVATSGSNSFTAIQNSYSANTTKVQLLRQGDPLGSVTSPYTTIDSAYKKAIDSIASQIDYSS